MTESGPKTLRDYLALCVLTYGQESPATAYIHRQIDRAPQKGDEPVLADQYQVLHLLQTLHNQGADHEPASQG